MQLIHEIIVILNNVFDDIAIPEIEAIGETFSNMNLSIENEGDSFFSDEDFHDDCVLFFLLFIHTVLSRFLSDCQTVHVFL